jgi:hypothetical protein
MNPQLNKIFSKLAKEDKKTELASQKIELNLTQDAKKVISKLDKDNAAMKKAIANIEKETKKVEAILDKALTAVDTLYTKSMDVYRDSNSEDEARAIYNKLETSAKDLGLNINDLPIAKQIADAVNRNSDTYQDVLSEISFSQKELK